MHTKGEQNISKEVKRHGKRIKAIREKKERKVCYVKLVHFPQCRAYFRPFMHKIVACMRVPFSAM